MFLLRRPLSYRFLASFLLVAAYHAVNCKFCGSFTSDDAGSFPVNMSIIQALRQVRRDRELLRQELEQPATGATDVSAQLSTLSLELPQQSVLSQPPPSQPLLSSTESSTAAAYFISASQPSQRYQTPPKVSNTATVPTKLSDRFVRIAAPFSLRSPAIPSCLPSNHDEA